jgi:hypothetical protein
MKLKMRILIIIITLLAATLSCSFVKDAVGIDEDVTGDVIPDDTGDILTSEKDSEEGGENDFSEDAGPDDPNLETGNIEDDMDIAPEDDQEFDSIFPLPDDVQNFMEMGDGSINFQSRLNIDKAINFYRQAFKEDGMVERPVLTAITDSTFSMVFDGHPEGTVVIQGVYLGNGITNINIRFEDL